MNSVHSDSTERTDDDDDDEDDDDRQQTGQPKRHGSDSDSEEEEEEHSNQRMVKQNKRHGNYQYELSTATRNSQMHPMGTQPGINRNPDVPTDNAPNAIWKNIDNQMQEVKVEKTAVHDFVSNFLFPKLKFLRGAGINMEYSTETKSICGLVMAGCHQAHSTEGMRWWGTAKKQTINEIKRLRNDASKNLKISFLGK